MLTHVQYERVNYLISNVSWIIINLPRNDNEVDRNSAYLVIIKLMWYYKYVLTTGIDYE